MWGGQTFRADIHQSRQIGRQSPMNWLVDLAEGQRNGNFSKYFGRLLGKNFKSDKIGIFTKKVTESDYFMKKVTKSEKSDLVGTLPLEWSIAKMYVYFIADWHIQANFTVNWLFFSHDWI